MCNTGEEFVRKIEKERESRKQAQIGNEVLKARIARADVECQRAVIEATKALKAQRDQLLDACNSALNHCDRETTYMLEAAIASVKGGA